ncbi:Grx4 family monothiol glutaredoxin [Enterobacteriaceae endosymbiont of Donacia bicoloricornis]|uniref:Grx4 family monothiol glutaredoxin n=1 Tax=Enterobacteriaceae endosymbiont of Donacia bicoloricornis TaxID=2675772 RepID=UPI001449FD2C|nr:Grx4 family monothiol glutaredoxin [Enterobacteriaceae endosymbiont of Donacia bicoloricornis]QJC37647.1 Grx4 family monothiol glutaredoxin [Enterobacteriaceae endosymbiont of Donacia bicoloricornis]
MKIFNKIKKQINNNPIILYMKGNPIYPQCGFSDKAVKIISFYKIKFTYVDVLKYPDIRKHLPKYANWPTFPQLWVNKELIGGYDILYMLHNNNKLKNILNFKKK